MRHIEIEYVEVWDKIIFKIVEQTHRGGDFTKNGFSFKDSSGFSLYSDNEPQDYPNGCCVQGRKEDKNGEVLIARSKEWFHRFCAAVEEYNKMGLQEVADVTCCPNCGVSSVGKVEHLLGCSSRDDSWEDNL